jgi:hypothetical protein
MHMATCPWQLQLDADEMPDPELLIWVAGWAKINDPLYGAVRIRRENLIDGKPIGEHTYEWHLRLFRRRYRYQGRIHEKIMVPDEMICSAPEMFMIRHHKTGARQDQQNAFYQAWPEQRAIVGGR